MLAYPGHEMRELVPDEMSRRRGEHRSIFALLQLGGIGVAAAALLELAILVKRERKALRKSYPAGRTDAEDSGISTSAAHVPRLQPQHHPGYAAVLEQIHEDPDIIRAPVVPAHIQETGIVGDRLAASHQSVVLRRRARAAVVLVEHIGSDHIVHVPSREERGDYAVLYHAGRVVKGGKRGYYRVICNLRLYAAQVELQRDVPVEGQPVGQHLHPVLLLAEAEDSRRAHEVYGDQQGIDDAVELREGVQLHPGVFINGPLQGLEKQRHAHEHGDERNIDHYAERVNLRELVQLEAKAGIDDYAPQPEEGERENTGHRDDQQGGSCPECRPAAYKSAHGVPCNIEGGGQHEYGQVDEYDRAERIQYAASGIEPGREHHILIADHPSGGIYSCQHHRQPEEHQAQPEQGPSGGKPEQSARTYKRKPYPENVGKRAHRIHERLPDYLELRLAHHRHRRAAVVCQRPDIQRRRDMKLGVHRAAPPDLTGVRNLQTAYDHAAVGAHSLREIPFGSEIHIAERLSDGGEGRFERIVRTCEQRGVDPVLEIVVVDRELVAPRLQGVPAIAVDDHVVGQAVKLQPARMVAVHRLLHEVLQRHHSPLHQ